MLVSKYKPKNLEEVMGNEEVKKALVKWILKWMNGEKQRPVLLWGPSGIGKTSVVHALAKEYDFQIVELSSSDMRDKANIERIIKSAMLSSSLFGKGKLIFIDDVDAMATKEDRGGITALVSILKNVNVPVVLTAENYWDKKLMPLRSEVRPLEMKRIPPGLVASFLKEIVKKEKIEISEERINEISRNSEGDIRSALNDLEANGSVARDRKREIFSVLKVVFKSNSLSSILKTVWMADVDRDLLKLWIAQNIPVEYESKKDVAAAYNWLSRADVFEGRIINRQCWDFMRYSTALMSGGVAFAKEKAYIKLTKYQYPTYLRKMSQSVSTRKIRKSLFIKLGKKVHLSSKRASHMVEIFKEIAKRNKKGFYDFYGLGEEEAGLLEKL